MKFIAKIILLLFISFQFAPSVLSLIDKEKGSKISLLLLDEEEDDADKENKEIKNIKVEFLAFSNHLDFDFIESKNAKVEYTYLLKKYPSYNSIILLPPELV